MKVISRRVVAAVGVTAMMATGVAVSTGTATAATKTGWVGPAGTTGYLHTSTIINSPNLVAESKIYHTFGASAGESEIGVRPRLFKSGALCEAKDYEYNWYASPEWTVRTSATCGSGWYNSHGFVAVWNAGTSSYNEFVTFPTDPLKWDAPSSNNSTNARAVKVPDSARKDGINSKGMTYGTASGDSSKKVEPDLILAIGKTGKVGYVKSTDLNRRPATKKAVRNENSGTRTIPVLDKEGRRTIDSFVVK